jgi:hypothetical protein
VSRILTDAVARLPRDEAQKYFSNWAADMKARFKLLDLAESIYTGPGDTAENAAVASLFHAVCYLEDRVAYEMNPHPKGMIRGAMTELESLRPQLLAALSDNEAKDAALKAARNLLAAIHRDGGHYTAEHGFIKSCDDAQKVRNQLATDLDDAKFQLEAKDARIAELEKHSDELPACYAIYMQTRAQLEAAEAKLKSVEGMLEEKLDWSIPAVREMVRARIREAIQ